MCVLYIDDGGCTIIILGCTFSLCFVLLRDVILAYAANLETTTAAATAVTKLAPLFSGHFSTPNFILLSQLSAEDKRGVPGEFAHTLHHHHLNFIIFLLLLNKLFSQVLLFLLLFLLLLFALSLLNKLPISCDSGFCVLLLLLPSLLVSCFQFLDEKSERKDEQQQNLSFSRLFYYSLVEEEEVEKEEVQTWTWVWVAVVALVSVCYVLWIFRLTFTLISSRFCFQRKIKRKMGQLLTLPIGYLSLLILFLNIK